MGGNVIHDDSGEFESFVAGEQHGVEAALEPLSRIPIEDDDVKVRQIPPCFLDLDCWLI